MANTQLNELERRVDEVLFYVWDPFNLKGEPYARDMYSRYVPELISYLESNKSAEEIKKLLIDIVENRMGLDFDHKSAMKLSRLLLRHKKAIDSNYI